MCVCVQTWVYVRVRAYFVCVQVYCIDEYRTGKCYDPDYLSHALCYLSLFYKSQESRQNADRKSESLDTEEESNQKYFTDSIWRLLLLQRKTYV